MSLMPSHTSWVIHSGGVSSYLMGVMPPKQVACGSRLARRIARVSRSSALMSGMPVYILSLSRTHTHSLSLFLSLSLSFSLSLSLSQAHARARAHTHTRHIHAIHRYGEPVLEPTLRGGAYIHQGLSHWRLID